jgi:hypothetical protein
LSAVVSASNNSAGNSGFLRLVDDSNGLEMASFSWAITTAITTQTTTTFVNIPVSATILRVDVRKTGGNPSLRAYAVNMRTV